MNEISGSAASGMSVPRNDHAQLRKLAKDLESVFLNQLFQAMRASVPDSGLIESSSGQDMFTAMMDEHLAREAAYRLDSKLSEALYRQLSRHLVDAPDSKPG